MHRIKLHLLTLFFVLCMNSLMAQTVEMASSMRSDGKIYVVVGVLLIIFLGLIVYLFSIDRKVKELEQDK